MVSLINECIVLERVIDEYRRKNRENPCSVCEHASEKCLSYLNHGIVPYTGEMVKTEEDETNVTVEKNSQPLKSTPRKKSKCKKRR